MKRVVILSVVLLAIGIPASIYATSTYQERCKESAMVAGCPMKAQSDCSMAAKKDSRTSCCTSKVETKKAEPVICPVMKGEVTDISKAQKSVYKGKTYYFCCAGCKPKFDKDPEKYIVAK